MMSKRIRFIIVIVACSLAGIFLFQGYWLYNSYQLSAQQFEKEVTEVLKHMERNHALADMERMGFFADSMGQDQKERLSNMVDMLMLNRRMPQLQPSEDASEARRKIRGTALFVSYADTTYAADHDAALDSILSIRHHAVDSVKLIHANRTGQTLTFDQSHTYQKPTFVALSQPLTNEIDSLLRSVGIGADFAFELSNFNGLGDTYVSDSTLFAKTAERMEGIKIGLSQPYMLTLAIDNDMVYILRNMLWVLLASVAIMGVTVWAFTYMLRTIFRQKRLSDIKNDFINNMTHEFKTPIATVSLAVEAMKHFDVMNKPEQAKEYLDICQHELKRISVMVEKVLKMAAFEQLDIKLSLQKTDIGKLISDVVENMKPQLEKKAAEITIQGSGEKVEAVIDRDHFSNVVYNLVDNSLKYADKVPDIEVSYRVDNDNNTVHLAVRDNGIGIPAAYRERVFENFFRVPTGNIHNAKGFGLGLGYVATIVKKHQGTIGVKSTVGEGSTFSITLPVNPHHLNKAHV